MRPLHFMAHPIFYGSRHFDDRIVKPVASREESLTREEVAWCLRQTEYLRLCRQEDDSWRRKVWDTRGKQRKAYERRKRRMERRRR